MSDIQCFVMEESGLYDVQLRVYEMGDCVSGYHETIKSLGHKPAVELDNYSEVHGSPVIDCTNADTARYQDQWPDTCSCGFKFTAGASRQYHPKQLWKHGVTGELVLRRDFQPGALFRLRYMEDHKHWCGSDGKSWAVITPGGEWNIDSRASNCTMPEDNVHKCWCRHGEAPNFTVDKQGLTCQAGAGSIITGSYHGFLRGGKLESC